MREHAMIGHALWPTGSRTRFRLACHGLDAKDNEFVIGLVSERSIRSPPRSSDAENPTDLRVIVQMGPFFVGYVTHRVT